MGFKNLSDLIWVLVFFMVGTTAATAVFYPKNKGIRQGDKFLDSPRDLSHIHRIKDFRYKRYVKGRGVLAIDAKGFTISRRKIGFLSVGLLNEAEFESAAIRVHRYSYPAGTSTKVLDDGGWESAIRGMPMFEIHGISSVVFRPVQIDTHMDGTVLSRILADEARYDIRDKNVLLRGNVRIVSGEKRLSAGRLNFNPATRRFHTEDGYVMRIGARRIRGKILSTDIMLNMAKGHPNG